MRSWYCGIWLSSRIRGVIVLRRDRNCAWREGLVKSWWREVQVESVARMVDSSSLSDLGSGLVRGTSDELGLRVVMFGG